ncbi:hypothetical protein OKW21_005472 [Catalinimonas alkaloidigena]|uniref:hypothetical protein n=1 Tax=Catalinimonas alkaloidigena TaxID=1075417 RepID=UPI0024050944|nr:hypothetical protein [Catalinimonas alkaloidigena]MDF9800209.1 hypothetical protein [Catalinimonas alkaloidigena]
MKILSILTALFFLLTLFGLYRPWLALWWSDYCPRIKVLKVYGSITLALSVIYALLSILT